MLEQRISLITLGVANLDRATRFYTEVLGWTVAPSPPEIRFFDMGGFVFSLFQHADLAKDMTSTADPGVAPRYKGFALAHNARSEADVDRIFAELSNRGATIVKKPERVFWGGYSGYFVDPDGHSWEVAYNPFWPMDATGKVSLPTA